MSAEENFITEQLLAEHSKAQTGRLVQWIGSDRERFDAMMRVFLRGEYRITQRCAWVVRYSGEKNPEMIRDWAEPMIEAMQKPEVHDAVRRNVLNVFEKADIPDSVRETLLDLCFHYIQHPKTPGAIQAAAISVAARICVDFPELMTELKLVLQEGYETGTPAFRSRARKVLR